MPESGWELDSGLRENIDLTIHSAYFSTHAEYTVGDNRPYLLFLIGTDENGDPYELRMSVGADWTSKDGGKTITHPSKRKVSKNSIYGHFIEAAWQCEDIVDGKRLRDVLAERGNGWEAEVWNDLILHLDMQQIRFGKNIDPQDRLLPTHYLGIATDDLSTPSQPATLSVSTPSPTEAPTNGASPLYQEMLDLARESESYIAFQRAAFARDDVLADEELAEQIADKDSGIWKLVKG